MNGYMNTYFPIIIFFVKLRRLRIGIYCAYQIIISPMTFEFVKGFVVQSKTIEERVNIREIYTNMP